MIVRRLLAAALLAALSAPAFAQAPPAPTPPPVPTEEGKAESEPRPNTSELNKPVATPSLEKPADKPKWDVGAPPGPTREVPIDVTSGTWMSLDVSPDGREVVFDLLGDLYVIPIGGGEARALTTGMAWDMHPAYSPNGRWIAFTSDRGGGDNIWIVDRDGSNPRQVTKETFRLLSQPDWTPDSEYIVARKHFTSTRSLGAGEMWLYHRSGGEGLQLTKKRTEQKDSGEPAFSPDGRYLYFSDDATPGGVFEYSKDVNGQIYVIQRLDREKGEVEPFVTGPGGSIRPTPSPDGKSLAFIRRVRYKSTLFVMDLASGRETAIFDGLDRDMQETWAVHGVYPSMAWTPDNKALVVWAGGKIKRVEVASKAVAEIPFHVKASRTIQEAVRFPVEVAPKDFKVKMLRWTEVSPAGDKVVYQALGHLWIKDLKSGAAPRRLTRQSDHFEFYPAWSRDGRSIVYTTWNDQDFGTVRVVPAGGGEGRVVSSQPGHYLEPAFSPDGATIVYRAVSDGFLTSAMWGREPGLYAIPAKGGGRPALVSKGGVQPQFGAAGDRVFFMTFEAENKRALKSAKLDGSEERSHLLSEFAAEYAISPDEKWVAWTERFNAYVMPFARTGKSMDISPKAAALPVTKVTQDAGYFLHWSGDGRKLWWSEGPELFSRDLKDAFAFVEGAPKELPKPAEHGTDISFTQAHAAPTGRTALTGARVVTMKGDEVIEDGVVVLNGNRIEAVGPRGSVSVPAGARVIDVAGKTIMPGIIDVHWHGSMGSDQIIPQQSWVNYVSLAFGVTTIHDPSNDSGEIFAHSELAKAGAVVGPRIFSTGTILYGAKAPFTAQIDSLDDARSTLRRMAAIGAFSVKSYNQPRREQRQQILAAARELKMMVVPEGGSLFEHDMTFVVDGHTGVEHSIPTAVMYDDVLQLWPATKVGYTPTLIVAYGGPFGENYWYAHTDVWADPRLSKYVPRRILDARARRPVKAPEEEYNHINIARMVKALADKGVSVQLGAHGQREGLGAHWEMWMMAQGGMTPMQVIKAATLGGAAYLGMDRDLGSLEPGKLADLVVLDADPLADIRNSTSIRYTVANGRVYDAMSMEELGGQAKKPFWFELPGAEGWGVGSTAAVSHQDD
ncbi:MAG: amidohydrolase family protein [Phenylobacterium sp.]|uniref:amidohydrolase family protein n=1 Tax=Phenylobacterium sp. TaxID=1871053 RepID=UPI0027332F23|nr:amidohydrolase family protein [Phenylobacterium sp.]MDP3749923.1 amidohydrolase family protein [Phenylobacterium sp.]